MSQLRFYFILQRTVVNIYFKDNFGSGSRSQKISAPSAPAPVRQHWFLIFYSTVCTMYIYLTGEDGWFSHSGQKQLKKQDLETIFFFYNIDGIHNFLLLALHCPNDLSYVTLWGVRLHSEQTFAIEYLLKNWIHMQIEIQLVIINGKYNEIFGSVSDLNSFIQIWIWIQPKI